MALEQPKLFVHYHEIESRENFDPECGVTRENFKSLVGEYQLPEDVRCQVFQATTGNCGRKHQHGWLGRIADGREGLIGGHCAVKYFNAHEHFASERNRVRREISISHSLEVLHSLLDESGAYSSRLETQVSRLRFLRQSRKELLADLPKSIQKSLEDMAKTSNRSVGVQIQYREVDDEGKEQVEWVDQSLGSIAGIGIWNYQSLGSIFSNLKEIRKVFDEVELSRSAGERKLKRWADTLNGLSAEASRIDELQQEFEQFTDVGNLALLIFIASNRDERIEAAKVALSYGGNQSPTSSDAKGLIDQYEKKIRENNGNRNIRVPR